MLKNLLKKYFYVFRVWDKLSPAVQISQTQLFHYYRDAQRNKSLPDFSETGFKVFSQFEEDGKLLFLFSVMGMGNKTFVDLGSHDGVNSNCANLAIHFGWRGLFIDGDKTVIDRGKHFYNRYPDPWSYKPKFVQAFVTPENVNDLIQKNGFEGEIDLLSVDIDGNDYWIWKAIDVVRPRVVVIESQVAFGHDNTLTQYKNSVGNPSELLGASNLAMHNLAEEKGYRLVGANQYGNNLFFVKRGLADAEIPEVPVEITLRHPFATERFTSTRQTQ